MSEAPATLEAPAPAEPPRSALSELVARRRLVVFLIALLVEFAIFVFGLLTPLSVPAQQTLENQTSAQFAAVPTASAQQLVTLIFTHNILLAYLELIPFLGAFVFVYSIYVTGLVAQVIATSAGYPGQLGVILFIFPYSLVEFSAYAIAVASGVMLVLAWRRKTLNREIRVLPMELAAVAAVLALAAAMETVTRFSPLIGFILWLPTGLGVAGIAVLSRRKPA
jgi:uncharacterized membrane protein SpoIIM required for sporulation